MVITSHQFQVPKPITKSKLSFLNRIFETVSKLMKLLNYTQIVSLFMQSNDAPKGPFFLIK